MLPLEYILTAPPFQFWKWPSNSKDIAQFYFFSPHTSDTITQFGTKHKHNLNTLTQYHYLNNSPWCLATHPCTHRTVIWWRGQFWFLIRYRQQHRHLIYPSPECGQSCSLQLAWLCWPSREIISRFNWVRRHLELWRMFIIKVTMN